MKRSVLVLHYIYYPKVEIAGCGSIPSPDQLCFFFFVKEDVP